MEKREYDIPLLKIGFYGTGICNVKDESKKELSDLILPIQDFVIPLINNNPIHVSTRYLGYYDEVSESKIKKVTEKVRSVFKDDLPLAVEGSRIFPSWQKNPDHHRKLLMLDVSDTRLLELHRKLLEITPDFPVFSRVERENFKPHFTLAEVKGEFANNIPSEISDFVLNFRRKVRVTFNSAYIWGPNGLNEL